MYALVDAVSINVCMCTGGGEPLSHNPPMTPLYTFWMEGILKNITTNYSNYKPLCVIVVDLGRPDGRPVRGAPQKYC